MTAREMTQRMFDAWNDRDWETLREALHPDYVYTGPDGVEVRGVEKGLAAAWTDYAAGFPDARVELKSIHVDGEVVSTEFRVRGTHTGTWEGIAPTGKRVEVDFCNVMQLKDGKVIKERDYLDTLGLFAQLGAVKMP